MAPYILHPRKFIEAFVMIGKKDGSFGKMILNKAQRVVMDEIERRMANNMPVRIRILKSRQQGATALCVALGNVVGLLPRERLIRGGCAQRDIGE